MKKLVCMAAAIAMLFAACKKEDTTITGTGSVSIEFENVINNNALILGTQNYVNAKGESFNVSVLKYYISNIELSKADGSIYKVPENYFLIDQSNPATLTQELQDIPSGDYNKITFTIGVDSTRNFSGAQTGALDVINGMFWTWNSGYIFVKLEGNSPVSTAASQAIKFHIGGASATVNSIRKVSFDMDINNLRIRNDKAPQIHFKANIAKMFTGISDVSFASTNTVMGGANSLIVANNYAAGMFTLDHIHN